MHNSNNSNEKLCSCPVGITTTFQEHFLKHGRIKLQTISDSHKSSDIELISGYIGNSLQYNGQPIRTKTWPDAVQYAENYDDFLQRRKYSGNEELNRYLDCSSIDRKIIKKILTNVNKTAYQLSFSPDIFTPRTEKRRFAKLKNQEDCMKYEETTYLTYFNRIEEMKRFKDILKSITFRENKHDLINDLKTIRYCGRTSYHDEISVLGKLYAKETLPGPIDRYTLRKI